jgi:segregation and condensation protein A
MRARARWGDVIDANAEPWQILSTLLALLELAKRGELRVAQSRPFASVEITGETASEAA